MSDKLKKLQQQLNEYSWSNPDYSVYIDRNNSTELEDEENESENEDMSFDNLNNKVDYPSSFFPDLHYGDMSKYYSQEMPKGDLLTARSCQMCAKHEKMHGLRYCRSCYDGLRYKKRKILNAPFNVRVPSLTNMVGESVDVESEAYKEISKKSGLRLDALKTQFEKDGVDPVKVIEKLSIKKLNPMDLMMYVTGNIQGQKEGLKMLQSLNVMK